ncbi:MAG: electron transport complex subunit RsxC [Sphaerochaeta sp.]|jgi:electron transport complex protein RnfC|nr:electron transport complex subunit RsxC [Sphaerochaeta sp.]PKL29059.1 MAG: electron transport complex subunit RsxC [Spirochaetae bacterium HGW-Spirochaetae-2]
MERIPTFRKGGVHPNDKKVLSNGMAIERLPVPAELIVPLSQHLGAPATPLKQKGDTVVAGEKIGQASSFISADIHSPVHGTIADIKKVTLANSVVTEAFVIVPNAENPLGNWPEQPYDSLSAQEMLAIIKDMGVVGTGGATFPTHVKLAVPKGKSVEALVVNGVECEPYLTADHRLMLEQTDLVLRGIMIVAKITQPKRIIIGVENNKKDAIETLRQVIASNSYPITVTPLKVKYPQGDEKQLLKATINREIPSGKLPLDVGAVVLNIGTSFAIYEAVALRKPLVERVVTVSGEAMSTKRNLRVLLGSKVADLIAFAGGVSHEPDKYISGGPMMGFAFHDDQIPVIKGTSGILALDNEPAMKAPQTPCISCGRCVAACPMGLQPTKLFRLIDNRMYAEAMGMNLMDCKECGCCSYSCPAHLPLVHGMKLGKRLGRK